MNQTNSLEEETRVFREHYLQPLRAAADLADYNFAKLLYCYHRFYQRPHMIKVMQYSLVGLVLAVSRTRGQLRRLPPLDRKDRELLQRYTDSLVRFFSVEIQLFEEQQIILSERLCISLGMERDSGTRDIIHKYLESEDGRNVAEAITKWANANMNEADKLVNKGDEHRRGDCPYVEDFIHQQSLSICVHELLNAIDPLVERMARVHHRPVNQPSFKAKVFLSYRRDDSGPMTGRIYDRLRSYLGDESVFIDVDTIPLGVDFREHLSRAVGQCDVLLAVIGNRWLEADKSGRRRIDDPNDFVRTEIEIALERKIPVVPIVVDRTPVPNEDTLPESLADLVYRNAIGVDSGPDFHNQMNRLILGLEQLFSGRRIGSLDPAGQQESNFGAEPYAAPNGGPAKAPDNSGATEGPASVS